MDHSNFFNSYDKKGNGILQHRIVGRTDVIEFSGQASKQAIDFHTQEDIEVDQRHIILHSHGEGRVSLVPEVSENDNEAEEDLEGSGITDQDIPPLETNTVYNLELQECTSISDYEDINSSDKFSSRTSHNAKRWANNVVKDGLMAKWDQRRFKLHNVLFILHTYYCYKGRHDQLEMIELRKNLPHLKEIAQRVSRSTDGDRKKKGDRKMELVITFSLVYFAMYAIRERSFTLEKTHLAGV